MMTLALIYEQYNDCFNYEFFVEARILFPPRQGADLDHDTKPLAPDPVRL